MYRVVLDRKVLRDLKQIDKKEQIKIIETIENRLAKDPFILSSPTPNEAHQPLMP